MKTPLKTVLVGLLILAAFSFVRWSTGQAVPQKPQNVDTTSNTYALEELTAFTGYLEQAKLTNALQRFNEFEAASMVVKESADIGIIAHVLVDLREGYTNDAIKLLEIELQGNAVGFATTYQQLPRRIRDKVSLQPLKEVRYYCTNYQFLRSDPDLFDGVSNALKLLDTH